MAHMDLHSITVNHATKPPRVVIYGDHGIGKTTFATSAPAPIVIRTEDGLAAIQVPTFPIATSYRDVVAALTTLSTQAHPFQTAVIDTLDWLEPLVWSYTAMLGGKDNIEDFGYGKGYKYADEHWRTILDGLNTLNTRGMTIICLAHMQIKKFAAPDTEAYDRYQLKLHERAIGLVTEWADVVGFAHQEVYTVDQEIAGGKKITRGTGGQRRILSVEERPAYDAKNRYALPADLEFSKAGAWDVFAQACAPAYAAPAPSQSQPWLTVQESLQEAPAVDAGAVALDADAAPVDPSQADEQETLTRAEEAFATATGDTQ